MDIGHQAAVLSSHQHTPATVRHWVAFLQLMEDRYARVAAARGEPFVRLSEEERLAAAQLAAALG